MKKIFLIYILFGATLVSFVFGDAIEDCAGVCNGNAITDECGECNGEMFSDNNAVYPNGLCDCESTIL